MKKNNREICLIICILLLCSTIFSATRIKTVEWNFGGRYNQTDLGGGTAHTFPTRTIVLPENGKVIRSAWLEFEGLACSALNVSALTIRFDAGPTASTIRLNTGQITTQTGESVKLYARADVTSVIASTYTTAGSSRNFTASVTISGPTSNSHTLKLFITYEYDDTSPIQVKTVRVPLYSEGNVASRLSTAPASTYNYNFHPYLPESGITVLHQWFEIRGAKQSGGSGTTDNLLRAGISGGVLEPQMCFDNSQTVSYDFLYLPSSTIMPGFNYTTSPTEVRTSTIIFTGNNIHLLGGECVITYIYNASFTSSPTQLKTIRYAIGQSTGSSGNFEVPIYFEEDGVTVRRVYAE
ncbi:MAG: hypothetical protein SNJ64_01775, partial [Endomicrobiia bacterium]